MAKIAVPSAPAYWHLTDDHVPTNPTLWQVVLDVARGKRREYTQGDRTIHSPNRCKGFKHWPNPRGIAWAIKQYNGFGGNWKGLEEVKMAKDVDSLSRYLYGVPVKTSPTSKGGTAQTFERLARKLDACVSECPKLTDYQTRTLELLKTGAVVTTSDNSPEHEALVVMAQRGLAASVGCNVQHRVHYWGISGVKEQD